MPSLWVTVGRNPTFLTHNGAALKFQLSSFVKCLVNGMVFYSNAFPIYFWLMPNGYVPIQAPKWVGLVMFPDIQTADRCMFST